MLLIKIFHYVWCMKPSTLKQMALPVDELFQKIWEIPELEEYIRTKAKTRQQELKINAAKFHKNTMRTDAKMKFLRAFGFEEVQVSLWRLK